MIIFYEIWRIFMSKKYQYYYPSLSKSLEMEIEKLFTDNEQVKNLYNNNKVNFIEDMIRKGILYYRDNERSRKKDFGT